MPADPIRVLIVEDSPVALTILQRILDSTPELMLVGIAQDGMAALELIPQVKPQVICTDLHMPRMGGLELIQRVMAECPCPILVISAAVDQTVHAENIFQLLQAGALDVFLKPSINLLSEYEQMRRDLIKRIKVLAGVSVFTIRRTRAIALAPGALPATPKLSIAAPVPAIVPKVVAIGASTGGPQALYTLLQKLPADFPVPILCVQHISQGFLAGLTTWLAANCSLRVEIARNQEVPQPGTVYFAPDDCHLHLDARGRFATLPSPRVNGHRPSVTVLLQSVAMVYQQAAVGVVLTGMGRDGAAGLLSLAQAGGLTIAQDEATSVVFGMPKEAIALGAAQQVLPLAAIAPALLKACRRRG